MAIKIEIVEASPIEWGLIINGDHQRTWWKSTFPDGKPTEDHPLVQEAIDCYWDSRDAMDRS